jgi:RHS repeat-associated protein
VKNSREKRRDGCSACYNGNICQSSWTYLTGAIHNAGWQSNTDAWKKNEVPFFYAYDGLNRMVRGGFDDDLLYFGEELSYDKHGNIVNLMRGGIVEHDWVVDGITPDHNTNYIDQLRCYYQGNQLKSVRDDSYYDQNFTGSQDFKDYTGGGAEYYYDGNGNMTTDLNKNIATIRYNYLNLPDTVQMGSGHMITNDYDGNGDKIYTYHYTATGSTVTMPVGSTLKHNVLGYKTLSSISTMYCDNMIYDNWALTKIQMPDGLLIRSNATTTTSPTFTYHYYVKDHLGNNRVVFHDAGDGTPVVDQVNNYYPFGMEYGESAEDQDEVTYQDYLFGGKEFDRKFEVNLYDFDARVYDATGGRFTTVDPLAEKYPSVSPYVYSLNNPLKYIDPNGLDVWEINNQGEIVNQIEDKTQDAFYLVSKDADGNYQRTYTTDDEGNKQYNSISFEYGTVTSVKEERVNTDAGEQTLTMFNVKGDDKATQLFEFMANPEVTTKVEWSHDKIGTEKSEKNIVGTMHHESKTAQGYYLMKKGYTIKEDNHSHPRGTGPSPADLDIADDIYNKSVKTKFNVYVGNGIYIPYYPKTINP